MWQQSLAEFKQVRFLVIYPAISVVMLVLVYLVKTPMICFVGAFVAALLREPLITAILFTVAVLLYAAATVIYKYVTVHSVHCNLRKSI